MSNIINKINTMRKVSAEYINKNGVVAFNEKVIEKINTKLNERKYNKNFERMFNTEKINQYSYEPLISIIVPTYNTPIVFLEEMINSVKVQGYHNWELCIADASTSNKTRDRLKEFMKEESRVKVVFLDENKGISENTNAAIEISSGEYLGLLDHDDLLTQNALYEVIKAINENNKPDFLYTDEDKIDEYGRKLFTPHFKPNFSPDLLCSCNYITHFAVFSKQLLMQSGKFNANYDGSQDYDLILRLTSNANKVVHIPKVLYHWRCHMNSVALNPSSKDYAYVAARKAVETFNSSRGYKCKVTGMQNIGHYKVDFDIIGNPKVNIIVRNVKSINKLCSCLQRICKNTTYKNRCINVVLDESFKDNLNNVELMLEELVNISFIQGNAVETATINKIIAQDVDSQYTILLDSKVCMVNKDWIEQMLMYCQRKNVSAVGGKIYYANNKIKHAGLVLDDNEIIKWLYHGSTAQYDGYFLRAKLVQNLSAVSWECVMIQTKAKIKVLDETYCIPLAMINYYLKANEENQFIVFNPFIKGIYSDKYTTYHRQKEYLDKVDNIMRFKEKWQRQLENDSYFNKNLKIAGKQIQINIEDGKY